VAVITVSRQMGSLGREIAHQVAEDLGYKVVWREVINQAALRANVPEVALATIDELDLFGIRPSTESRSVYHQAVQEIMNELYKDGNVVIIGRAGQAILRGREYVLHIRIYAPFELRVLRTVERFQISVEAAHTQVEASDAARIRYLKKYYQIRWDDPDLYDLMINTAHLSVSAASALICNGLK